LTNSLDRIEEEPRVFDVEKVRRSMEEFLSVGMSHNEEKVRRQNQLKRMALKEDVVVEDKMLETATRPAELIDRVRGLLRKSLVPKTARVGEKKADEEAVNVKLPIRTLKEPVSEYRRKMKRNFDRSFPKRLYE
jgi:hypothetical protein